MTVGLLVGACLATPLRGEGPEVPPVFGNAFDREIAKPLVMTRSRVALRPLLQRLTSERGIGILLDRRVDPGQTLELQLREDSTLGGIARIAEQAAARLSRAGDTLIVGPPEPTGKLRTLITLREGEILDAGMKLRGRQFELSRKRTLQWPDLEEPRPLIERAAGEYGLRVEGLERIPYDLWGAGQLVNVNAAEALTALLIQFDLTFAWTGDADGVRLVAIPDEVAVKRLHRPRRGGVEAAVRTVARAFPRRTVTRQGAGLELAATVEEHEEVERLLGNRRAPQGDRPAADLGPLRQRRFTLSVVRQPASRIIETLETQDVTVDYDPDALEEAGIDLEQKVSLDLSQASADEFFRALCEPLGLDFAIDDRTATLTPRK